MKWKFIKGIDCFRHLLFPGSAVTMRWLVFCKIWKLAHSLCICNFLSKPLFSADCYDLHDGCERIRQCKFEITNLIENFYVWFCNIVISSLPLLECCLGMSWRISGLVLGFRIHFRSFCSREDEHQLIAQFCRALRHTRRHQTLPNKLQGRAASGDVVSGKFWIRILSFHVNICLNYTFHYFISSQSLFEFF